MIVEQLAVRDLVVVVLMAPIAWRKRPHDYGRMTFDTLRLLATADLFTPSFGRRVGSRPDDLPGFTRLGESIAGPQQKRTMSSD